MVERGIAGPKVTGSIPVSSFFIIAPPPPPLPQQQSSTRQYLYTSFAFDHFYYLHLEPRNIAIFVLIFHHDLIEARVLLLGEVTAQPFALSD